MATFDDSKFFKVVKSNELNEVLNVTLVSSLGVWILEVGEPFMFVWNI